MGGGASTLGQGIREGHPTGVSSQISAAAGVDGLVSGFIETQIQLRVHNMSKSGLQSHTHKLEAPRGSDYDREDHEPPDEEVFAYDRDLPPLHLSLRTNSPGFVLERTPSTGLSLSLTSSSSNRSGSGKHNSGKLDRLAKQDSFKDKDIKSIVGAGIGGAHHGNSGYFGHPLKSVKSLRALALRSHSRQENAYISPTELVAASSYLHLTKAHAKGPTPRGGGSGSGSGSNLSAKGGGGGGGDGGGGSHGSSVHSLLGGDGGTAATKAFSPNGSGNKITSSEDVGTAGVGAVGQTPSLMPASGPGRGLTIITSQEVATDEPAVSAHMQAAAAAAAQTHTQTQTKPTRPQLKILVSSSGSLNMDDADWIQVSDEEGEEEDMRANLRQSLSLHSHTAQQSYMLTKSGTIFVDGFSGAIGKGGINTAGGSASGMLPLQDRLVFLCRLGAGASGVVYKALDLRDMRLVALKMIPMFDRGKRRQMVRELSALFQVLHQKNERARLAMLADVMAAADAKAKGALDALAEEKRGASMGLGLGLGLGLGEGEGVTENQLAYESKEEEREKRGGGEEGEGEGKGESAGDLMQGPPAVQGKQQHPYEYIVDFFDAFSNIDDGDVALMMEYMDGGSLQDIVVEGGCDNEETLASIASQALVGLAFLHRCAQLHRDLKPGNFLISKRGWVKIADFGILRQMDDGTGNGLGTVVELDSPPNKQNALSPKAGQKSDYESIPRAQTFVGTATYMAPERIDGRDYSYPSDIWSFGLSLLTIALGRLPIDTEGGYWTILHHIRDCQPPKVPERFSPEFRDFIDKCLQKDPGDRHTAMELLQHPFLQCAAVENDTDGDEERGCAELQAILRAVYQHLEKRRQDCIKNPPTPVEQTMNAQPGTITHTLTNIGHSDTREVMRKIFCIPPAPAHGSSSSSSTDGNGQQQSHIPDTSSTYLRHLALQLHLAPSVLHAQVSAFLDRMDKSKNTPTPVMSSSSSGSGSNSRHAAASWQGQGQGHGDHVSPPDFSATPKARHF